MCPSIGSLRQHFRCRNINKSQPPAKKGTEECESPGSMGCPGLFSKSHLFILNRCLRKCGKLLKDAEMAEMMLFSMDGIVVNDETLSVDVIKEVGPRSDFLAHMNTFKTCTSNQSPNALTALPVTAGTKRGTSTWKPALSLPRRNSSPRGNRNPSLRMCPCQGSAQRRRT